MKLSITLPSLFPDDLRRALAAIEANTRAVDYEVVVVSPFEVRHPRVTWVREEEARGNCPAQLAAFAQARGEFVLAFSDDAILLPGWDESALANFQARERQTPFCLGLSLHTRAVGTTFGIYYPFFPFARRAAFAALGFYSPDYRAHFADSDLAFRFWDAGGRCEFSERPLIVHQDRRDDGGRTKKYVSLAEDTAAFLARWKPKYGQGWRTEHFQDFNLEINAATQLTLVRDNSVYFNDPLFRQLYDNFQDNIRRCRVQMTFPE